MMQAFKGRNPAGGNFLALVQAVKSEPDSLLQTRIFAENKRAPATKVSVSLHQQSGQIGYVKTVSGPEAK
jgi:hypothetical protein